MSQRQEGKEGGCCVKTTSIRTEEGSFGFWIKRIINKGLAFFKKMCLKMRELQLIW